MLFLIFLKKLGQAHKFKKEEKTDKYQDGCKFLYRDQRIRGWISTYNRVLNKYIVDDRKWRGRFINWPAMHSTQSAIQLVEKSKVYNSVYKSVYYSESAFIIVVGCAADLDDHVAD